MSPIGSSFVVDGLWWTAGGLTGVSKGAVRWSGCFASVCSVTEQGGSVGSSRSADGEWECFFSWKRRTTRSQVTETHECFYSAHRSRKHPSASSAGRDARHGHRSRKHTSASTALIGHGNTRVLLQLEETHDTVTGHGNTRVLLQRS